MITCSFLNDASAVLSNFPTSPSGYAGQGRTKIEMLFLSEWSIVCHPG